jgi:hypothetical protein
MVVAIENHIRYSPFAAYGASKIVLNGVSAARRTLDNPPPGYDEVVVVARPEEARDRAEHAASLVARGNAGA